MRYCPQMHYEMKHESLRARWTRRLVYVLCSLMAFGGQPALALQETVRIVPREEHPEWFAPWLEAATYQVAAASAGARTTDTVEELQHRLGTWWDGAWSAPWASLTNPSEPLESAVVPTPIPVATGAAGSGSSPWLVPAILGQSGGSTRLPKMPDVLDGNLRPPAEVVRLMAAKADLESIPLIPGMNLISLPEEPTSTDPAEILAPIGGSYTRILIHDACDSTDPWKVYDPNDASTTDLTALDHTDGIWIEAKDPVSLPSDGTLPATTTFQLCTGWNLIGYPAGRARTVRNALHSIDGKWVRVYGYDASDPGSEWQVYDVGVPEWGNDLKEMLPGRGYWVLVTEDTTLEIANDGPEPFVAFEAPVDLDVVTDFTDVVGTVRSQLLKSWRLTYQRIGDGEPVEIATGRSPVESGILGTFDPTLLVNGLYELKLEAEDEKGRFLADSIAVAVEGNMKIGHFTLSFVDLAIPLSGLDIEILRTYDSREKDIVGDFGHGWTLDIRQGSYQNNRPPGDGWQIINPGGPFGLPCSQTIETKSHLTTVTLSDQEVYRFRLSLTDQATVIGGCQARAIFEWVDGPLPGSTLEILGNDLVIYENESDRLIDQDSLDLFVPENVRLTTRDGRIFHVNLETDVTHLEDLNGNAVDITVDGITHSSGVGIDFVRDAEGRIVEIVDPRGNANRYAYDAEGDLAQHTDRAGAETGFAYREHYLEDIHNALGVRAVRTEYDADGRMVRHIDADGNSIALSHDLDQRQEIVTNRLGQSRLLEYDGRGNVVREVDETGAVTERIFDGRDNLLTEKDPLGRVTTYTYTAENDLASFTNDLDETTKFTYDERGQILTLTDPNGNVTTSSYDTNGNLLSTTDPLDQTTTFSYDASGNLLSTTDVLGHTTHQSYNSRGDVVTDTDPLGHVTSYTYDSAGNRLSESRSRTLPDGSTETLVTNFAYDELDRVVKTTAADGTVTRTSYDALGRVTSRTDELGRVTKMAYDAQGRLVETTFPDGTSETRSYDAEGRVLTRTDRAGRVTEMAYDGVGRLLTTTFADGATQSQTYDAAGQLVATTDARGNSTTYTYDAAGRRVGITDALDQTTSFGYDANGSQTSVTDARGHTTEFIYDALDRLVTTTYPDGTTTEVGYDALGRRVQETDQAGISTRFGYDALGRLVSVTDALDQVTSYSYDEGGNRLTQTDANGHTTRFEYDRRGRQIARILPDDARETMSYHADGTLASHTDFAGNTRTFEYDANQRLVSRAYPDGTEHLFSYTATGQRETATDARGVTSYAYDARDRLLEKQDPTGHKLTYSYDPQGNLASLTATVGTESYTTSYGYDALNRQVEVTDPQGGVTTLAYDANGNRSSLRHANGLLTTYDYDQLNRLELLETRDGASNVVQSYAYTLAPTGHRMRINEADGTVRSYAYDALYRLTQDQVTDTAGDLQYQHDFVYDPVGNRLSQTIDDGAGSTVIASSYDERDRLLAAGSSPYNWDANGQLTDRDADGFAWDFNQRLSLATLEDGTVTETIYDVDGNRVQTQITMPDGTLETVSYLMDTRGTLSHVIAEVQRVGVGTLYVRSNDELLSLYREVPGEERYFHSDGLGSVRMLSDKNQLTTDSYAYSSFGRLLSHEGNDPQPYMFAAEPIDPNSGFYYNRARWMDPTAGAFISMDPFPGYAKDPQSLHRYTYAKNDPVNRVDPTGRQSMLSFAVGQAVLGGLISGVTTFALTRDLKKSAYSALGGFVIGFFIGATFHWVRGAVIAARSVVSTTAVAGVVDDTLIAASKLRWLLDPKSGKGEGFRQLGYSLKNVGNMAKMLRQSRGFINQGVKPILTEFGKKYEVVIRIIGPSGRMGKVKVVWQVDEGSQIYRLITAIPKPFK